MYRAKRDGRRLAAVYDVRSDDASRRLSLLARLRRAIAREELGLHFQPLLDLGTGVPESAECLARWEDRVHGRVAPDVFVELAESGGLVVALGELVVHRAAAQLAAWDAAGVRVPALAVNISARHLRNGALLDTIDSALAAHGLEHRRLVVELTESAVMEDADRTMPVLRALRERGVSVSVDDFGTGYSSLARLLHLPVDVIKLDRTFIAPLPDPRALALVEAVQRLGQGLGLSTVAEGVETAAQLRQLQQIGYRYGQGYHIARPMPADQFELWLAGRTGTRPLTAATA
jgi:EAL domain-containing protein (putative c-di-GMP-specific phosphodiesterase class I)